MNILRTIFLATISVMCVFTSYAYTVSGRVVDAISGEPEPFATYRIYSNQNTQKPLYVDAADIDGKFQHTIANPGSYLIEITYTGTKPQSVEFSVSAAEPDANIGDIALSPDSDMLQEVTVVAKKPIVEANGDKVVYNAEVDASVQNKTVLDMLRKVPMVTVDAQDNIQVNGQSDFKIYVNGRPEPMLNGSNKSDILKMMPAGVVKKVEVLAEPGAKYDSEGVGGVLNIITETKTSVDGQTASLTAGVSVDRVNANLYALARRKNITASLTYGYGHTSPFYHRKQQGSSIREDFNSDLARYTVTELDASVFGNFHYGNMQLSWEPDSLNLFTVSGNGFAGDFHGDVPSSLSIFDKDWKPTFSYDYYSNMKMKFAQLSAVASYQHTFKTQGHNIIASYQYSYGQNTSDIANKYSNPEGEGVLPDDMRNMMKTPTHEHTLQLDYTLPFGAGHVFETGAKGVMRRNKSIGDMYTMQDGSLLLSPELSSTLKQYQDVGALYATATAKWRKWTLKGGLRFEYTHMGVNFLTEGYKDFAANLSDWVPNAMLSYQFSTLSSLRLSYQMRIRRPSADQLNPFRQTPMEGPSIVEYGNPDLTSERNNNVTLTYSTFFPGLVANISAAYSQSNNLISKYSFVEDGVLNRTYANTGNRKQVNISGFFSITAIPKLSLNIYATAEYSNVRFDAEKLANHGWQGNFNINLDYKLPWEINLGAYGGMMTGFTMLQGSDSGWHYYGLSLSRNFLKDDALRISLTASDMFEGHEVFKNSEWGDGFRNDERSIHESWSVGFSVTYRFGNMKGSVKQTDKSIVNDDVETTNGTGALSGSGKP